ncbi:hypothetical protein SK128_025051 [Halocaridina rubra]|uniref:Uncharacterized protein n=1 Tax=Halocaridina rubra TaxID=373956 RepID=A0AAN8X4P1_HALRR
MPIDLVDFYDSFKKSDSALFHTLAERVTFVSDFKEGMKQTTVTNSAYFYERLFLELMIVEHFTDRDGSTPLYVAQQNIVPGYCGWPIIRDAPFKRNIDKFIMDFHGAGLITKWTDDILKEARLDSRKKQLRSTKEVAEEATKKAEMPFAGGAIMALTLTHMQGPFFLLLLGLLLSSVIFITECLIYRCSI